MARVRTSRSQWVEQGLKALAAGGPDAVRIEALARQLGVTKGGFYGSFTDRDALLEAMLDTWEQECTDEVLDQIEHGGNDARTKIQRAGRLTFSSDRLLPIDLAIRDWSRRDDSVAQRLGRVDDRRMGLLRELIGTVCDDAEEVEARSLLAFCLAIGEHFLGVGQGAMTRRQVLDRATDVLLRPSESS